MSHRFLITEEEKKDIRKQYGLLKEQTDGPFVIEMKTLFGNGKYKNFSAESKQVLDAELQKAAQFIKNNPKGVPYVKIIAGESQVTNKDREVNPPKEVEPGYLSIKRAEMMKNYISKYFKTLTDTGYLKTTPIFEASETKIGTNTYDSQKDNPNDKKYEDERFVKVEIAIKQPYECIVGLTVEVRYVKTAGGVGSDGQPLKCRGGHSCDRAIFDVKLNGVKIGVANLNNQNDAGDRSSGPLVITDALAKSIIGDTSKNIIISLKCSSGASCHSSTPEIEVKKGNTVIFHQCAPSMTPYGDQNEMKVLELDNCGNLLKKSDKDATNTKTTESSSWSNQNTSKPMTNIKYFKATQGFTLDDTRNAFLSQGYIKFYGRAIDSKKVIYIVVKDFTRGYDKLKKDDLIMFVS